MKIEIRSNDTAIITGYVNVVGRESRMLRDLSGQFVEIIKPKTFQRALEKNANVGLMFNHKRDLAKREFELVEDNIGLHCRAEINDKEVIEKAKEGKLTGWSFGFYSNNDEFTTRTDGMRVRTVNDIDLVEVSILDCTPAYIATSIECRGGNETLKEYRAENDTVSLIDMVKDIPPPNTNDVENLLQQKRKFNFMLEIH